ncbi:hypothetical protein HOLleu_03275 [Holothuria leucospilota]|uniref:Uncharacterized protein n=1 Tax=Holothuria leucospilota TaxID=206669 RepID=A0A9Q1CQL5_HOLLE|nr:hypothetical protein HOLleu_03275 [Holothuria leucospilota]
MGITDKGKSTGTKDQDEPPIQIIQEGYQHDCPVQDGKAVRSSLCRVVKEGPSNPQLPNEFGTGDVSEKKSKSITDKCNVTGSIDQDGPFVGSFIKDGFQNDCEVVVETWVQQKESSVKAVITCDSFDGQENTEGISNCALLEKEKIATPACTEHRESIENVNGLCCNVNTAEGQEIGKTAEEEQEEQNEIGKTDQEKPNDERCIE